MCPGKNLSGALQIGTEIPMHVKSAMSEFYISSGSLFKQLWKLVFEIGVFLNSALGVVLFILYLYENVLTAQLFVFHLYN